MAAKTNPDRSLQFIAIVILALFVVGLVYAPLGAWTGAILSAWFIGTQRPWRGCLLLADINLIMNLSAIWRAWRLGGSEYAGWSMLAVVIGVLPFLLYRLVSQRRPGFLAALALPSWGVALLYLEHRILPARLFHAQSLTPTQVIPPLPRIAAILGAGAVLLIIYWFAALVIWLWYQEFQAKKIALGASIFGVVCAVVLASGFLLRSLHPVPPQIQPAFTAACWVVALILSLWGLLAPSYRRQAWAKKGEVVALLRSPYTGAALQVAGEGDQEVLLSPSGERFPICNGIPVLLEPEKLTGSNQKLNRLYETIGGFYDDTNKVVCALRGIRLPEYLWGYLRFLEIKPGDWVLETSVGTGLNFQYLPRGVKLFGLDLSAEMLANCQANLRRWQLDADLFLGNAEDLPFADDSFDVVFHVGGINFFNDRAKAIREMIRVAKPGTRILIADETEKHVKDTYERGPFTRGYFKNRQALVAVPVDLVPPEMQEIHLEILRDGRFYALTFRKPAAQMANSPHTESVGKTA